MDAHYYSKIFPKVTLIIVSLVMATAAASRPLAATSASAGLSKTSMVTVLSLDGGGVRGIISATILSFLELKLQGIWMGMIGGVVTETIALVYMAWATDWDELVKKASERLNRFYVKSSEDPE